VTAPPPPPSTLPDGWTHQDIGATGAAGSAVASAGVFTVMGAGADVWGTSDALQYAYTTMAGDGTIAARVATVQNVANWTKAGVMIRNGVSPSAAQALMFVSPGKGVAFQRRLSDGASSVSTSGTFTTAPRWVKLTRAGNTITAFESADGATWSQVGSDTFQMGATVDIGLAVSSHLAGVLATATFDSVSVSTGSAPSNAPPTVSLTTPVSGATFVAPATIALTATAADTDGSIARVAFYSGTTLLGTATASPYTFTWPAVPAGSYSVTAVATDNLGASATSPPVTVTVTAAPPTLPAGWAHTDIGAVPFAGAAAFAGGTFTITGSGLDIWGTADQFHYAYQPLTGDATIIVRVASVQNVTTWVKAGIMVRETLAPNSAHASIFVSAAKGVAFQRRDVSGIDSVNTAGTLSQAPRWVKLTRAGNLFSAYESADGLTWTLVGTDTIPMANTVYVGLAVTSHTTSAAATCTFDGFTIR
jgi:regulation of enolase protein 1 (concanavalin A-like superfamily)